MGFNMCKLVYICLVFLKTSKEQSLEPRPDSIAGDSDKLEGAIPIGLEAVTAHVVLHDGPVARPVFFLMMCW